eukprot:TRINITY_DN21338_c0_g1_i1.p1 TRINITY_DN21338_c0_g1~~TRINITY_DN21338_c0_g1_i1.p1  ORF type:complete len:249 (+),score=48.50 TRINITY_DN21338_c0_g1_i1:107-748(+)
MEKLRKGTAPGPWTDALVKIARHPEKEGSVLEVDDLTVVLHDMYAKARYHLLVLARLEGFDRITDARQEHLPLLRHMVAQGRKWAVEVAGKDARRPQFRYGFHVEPSLRQLHLHVISQDLDSPKLKNKKHWNSFTTSFFLDVARAIEAIEQHGRWALPPGFSEHDLLSRELRCHRCRCMQPNLPRLKQHIGRCEAPCPGEPLPLVAEKELVMM